MLPPQQGPVSAVGAVGQLPLSPFPARLWAQSDTGCLGKQSSGIKSLRGSPGDGGRSAGQQEHGESVTAQSAASHTSCWVCGPSDPRVPRAGLGLCSSWPGWCGASARWTRRRG